MDGYAKGRKQIQNHINNVSSHGHPSHQYSGRHDYYNMDGYMDDTRDLSYTDNTSGSTKYLDYPAIKPFINVEYKQPDTQVYPNTASDRDAVVTALRHLQDKIKNLEIERTAAEKNLHSLASETEQYKQILTSGRPTGSAWGHQDKQIRTRPAGSGCVHQNERTYKDEDLVHGQTREQEGQLSSAEHRCQLLEKQLLEMRKLVENSERNQRELMEKMGRTRQERDLGGVDIRQHIDKLNELERDQTRLAVTQTLAESKIRELEKKIKEEKLHRRTMQEKTAQLESETQNKKVLPSQQAPSQTDSRTAPTQVFRTKKSAKKKKKAPHNNFPAGTCRPEPKKHYRLNLAEIPFVAGKSTGPSHALGANVQKVLAMMKLHNSALCSPLHASGDCQGLESGSSTCSSMDQDLNDLLVQLQDEFGHLSSKHQEMVDQLHVTRDFNAKEKLRQELDLLVGSMENKSQQISTIKQHQKKMEDARYIGPAQAKKNDKPKRTPAAAANHHHLHHSSNIIHRNKPKPRACNKPVGHSALGRPELFMLRDMKKLQSTLRRDDLCWE